MGLDSVELIMSFEEGFGIDIPDAVAENLVTPRDVRDFIVSEYLRLGRPADPEAIFEKIRALTVECVNVRPQDVTLDAHFIEDLGLD